MMPLLMLIAIIGAACVVCLLHHCHANIHRAISTAALAVIAIAVSAPRKHDEPAKAAMHVDTSNCTHSTEHKSVETAATELLAAHFKQIEQKRLAHAR